MSTQISKKMLINVMHPEETRVAIVHDGRLMELNIEISGKEQIKGNIYKGIVLRVEPGLQAAFVDIGRAKPGFLQIGELHPDYFEWRDDIPEDKRKRFPRIQEVLHRGQELLVQVEKDERDNKGSALTTYVSLPGRYMVMMPGSDSSGISRKVEQEGARKKLKEIVAGMDIPDGTGYIMRTEAVGRTSEELQKDFTNLTDLFETIKEKATTISGAGEIYRDSGLIIRTIRDYFSDDIDEVLVDSKDAYREAKEFFRDTMPAVEKRVKLHKEKRPIFSRFQLEEQIDQIYEKRVPLPSGGSLIIEPTEALVSIDVNSGKSSGERGIEDTAFKANMEAAEEVARQLRLRDLGGLIVIDFIDMRENKHNIEVEKTLKNALKMDKARVNVGRISQFGIMEMSRQRIAKTLNDAIYLECPHCEGRGKVKSVEAMAVSFLRKVHAAAAKGTVGEVRGGLPLEVAYYLLNRKKRELTQIENDYEIEVTVKGKTSFLLNQLELEIVKREIPHLDDVLKSEAEAEEAHKTTIPHFRAAVAMSTDEEPIAEGGATTEGGKKRKRRKKKKKSSGDVHHEAASALIGRPENEPEAVDHFSLIDEVPEVAEVSAQDVVESTVDAPAKPKKRKRKKKKTVGDLLHDATDVRPEQSDTFPAEDDAEAAGIPSSNIEEYHLESDLNPKKRKRKRSRSKVHKTLEGSTGESASETAPEVEELTAEITGLVPLEEVLTPVKPKRTRTPRKKSGEEAAPVNQVVSEPVVAVVIDVVPETALVQKKQRQAAPKIKTVPPVVSAAEPGTVPAKPVSRARRNKQDNELK